MSNDSINLLQRLASGVRAQPESATSPGAQGAAAAGFADLLKQAQSGAISSERPVSISKDAAAAGVKLTAEQVGRLSAAADRAEVAGVRSALVLIDGQALKLDVGNRTITAPADAAAGGVVSGIDGVINLTPNLLGPADKPAIVKLPMITGSSTSLAALLERRETDAARAA